MKEEFKFSVHEYTYIGHSKELVYRSHETNHASLTIKEIMKGDHSCAKVFLILNGVENEEEAYVFEKRAMMRVYSYDAIKAVEIIACMPFFQYTRSSLIAQLTESIYREFESRPSENSYPF